MTKETGLQAEVSTQVGFRKGRGTSDQTANICWIIDKARQKHKAMLAPNDCLPTLCTPGYSILDILSQTDVAASASGHLHLPCSYKEQE